MNDDHQEACLLLIRAFTEHKSATSARMTALDVNGLSFSVNTASSDRLSACVPFPKPVNKPEQIRGMIVSLTKKAREQLSQD